MELNFLIQSYYGGYCISIRFIACMRTEKLAIMSYLSYRFLNHTWWLFHECRVMSPLWAARETASVRLVAPSLPMMELTWNLAVRSLIVN